MKTSTLELGAMRLVPAPRAVHKLAVLLALGLLAVPPLMALVPWRQNISASGRVIALDPLDRMQTIPAPVTGRLVRVMVQEGSEVEQGDLLVEMSDQDPLFAERLEQQYRLAMDKVQAARDQISFYTQQLASLEAARELAVSSARFELNMAIEGVRAAEQGLIAAEADQEQKQADRDRRDRLFARGVVSELDNQKAAAEHRAAVARVEAARATVERARNGEQAHRAEVGRVGLDLKAKIESIKSHREDARSKSALAEKELTEAETRLERQKTRLVLAPRDGRVFRIAAAARADLVKQGEPLLDLVPLHQIARSGAQVCRDRRQVAVGVSHGPQMPERADRTEGAVEPPPERESGRVGRVQLGTLQPGLPEPGASPAEHVLGQIDSGHTDAPAQELREHAGRAAERLQQALGRPSQLRNEPVDLVGDVPGERHVVGPGGRVVGLAHAARVPRTAHRRGSPGSRQ